MLLFRFFSALFFGALISACWLTQASAASGALPGLPAAPPGNGTAVTEVHPVYLPLIVSLDGTSVMPPLPGIPRTNIPYFENEILGAQTAILWFGKVTPTENSTDVRIGYNRGNLWVRVSVIDRRLWYDPKPSLTELTEWDAVSLYLNLDGRAGPFTAANTYRLDAQLNWWEAREPFQAAFQPSGGQWTIVPLPFTAWTKWWGFPQPNDDRDDRAWAVYYVIPFQSLGLGSAPPQGTLWRLGVQVHDRDDAAGAPIPATTWPPAMQPETPATWGQMHFGLPVFSPPDAGETQAITLRNGLNGAVVPDGVVGGNTECGYPVTDYWNEWGDRVYRNERDVNVQNQGNTDDWPCFSKYYITFPLDSLPAGKVIVSAVLTLHQSGNATGFETDPPEALDSLIQVLLVEQDWDPASLSWNNAPLPVDNVSRAWVGSDPAELGISRTWDVSQAAAWAYAAGQPLRLALYSADFYGPHGKYFFSSTSDDYGGDFRPSLEVVVGSP